MSIRSNAKKMRDLISAIDEVLFYEWDPIGINDCSDAFDEYSSYAPGLLRFAMRGNPEVVADQLARLATVNMGLSTSDRQHELRIAKKLIEIASLV